ncbi:MAG: hydroxymethylbilane synthase, partial [Candidatus Baltobacteraceae bacterium]
MLPIALFTHGRRALLTGGGNVAARKAETLHAAGLHLHVVAPRIEARIHGLLCSACSFAQRPYQPEDLAGIDLAIAATNDPAVNAQIVQDAREARVPVCDATAPERGDFSMQATVRVGDLTFTVDSGGSTPAFSQRIARELAERFDQTYADAAKALARMRVYVQTVCESAKRAEVMRELAAMPVDELAAMNPAQAEHAAESAIERLRGIASQKAMGTVVCASRASALAMTQTRSVAARLAEHGIATTIRNITTTGDTVQDRPVSSIGSTNVFVTELELALREGRADYAVHSCKDLPGVLESDMQLAAISQREDARDAFCSERYESFSSLPAGAVVGTSSPRRRSQLFALRADLCYEDIRGNVDTRLRKLREGTYDAIVLAMAGLNRLRMHATYTVPFAVEDLVPAVAQGALAIETRRDEDGLASALRASVNDREAELCVTCERAALRTLRAGCSAPLGVHAQLDGATMNVRAAFALSPGNEIVTELLSDGVTTIAQAEALGERIGRALARRISGKRARLVVLARTQERPSRIAEALRARGVDVVELRDGEAHAVEREPDMLVFPSSGSVDAAHAYL